MRKKVLLLALTSLLMSLCIPVFAQQAYVKPKVLAQYVIKIGELSEETIARPKGKEDYTQNVYQLPDGITFKELIFGLPGIKKNDLGRLVTKEGKEIVSSIFFNELPVFSRKRYYTNNTKLKAAPFSSSGLIYTDDTKLNSGTAFVQIRERTDGIQGAQIIIEYYQDVSYDMVGGNSEYVDLGLSVKWASRNVDAAGPEEMGGLYFWGETETKDVFESSTYKFRDGHKYNDTDGKTVLDPEDDVAHVKWGGSWRMPTADEIDELIHNCTWSWASVKGEIGFLVTSNKPGYTGRSIFLPYFYAGSEGSLAYWSGSFDATPDRGAACLWIHVYDYIVRPGYCYRTWNRPVRPVCQ